MQLHGYAAAVTGFLLLIASPAPLPAAGFGTVIPVGGQASDIALDNSRGVVYAANFTANAIDVISLSDQSIHSSLNVAAQPAALALSMDAHYLLVAHYGNWTAQPNQQNLVTLIDLTTGGIQSFPTADSPLGAAFLATGKALVVTQTTFQIFDPATGAFQILNTLSGLSSVPLPNPAATYPQQFTETALAASADGYVVWGVGKAGTGAQVVFRYDAAHNLLATLPALSTPPLLARVSVNADGSQAMIGFALFGSNFTRGVVLAQYPDPVASLNITGSAIDGVNNIVYAQVPDAAHPTAGPPFSGSNVPVLSIMSASNLTVNQQLIMPEDIVGRAVLSADGQTLYAVSESGLMVLPVGQLNPYPRVAAGQEDVFLQSTPCSKGVLTQSISIFDPGNNHTDFTVSTTQAGVTLTPSSGTTPAIVQISVDPAAFQGQIGTTAISIAIASKTAVNIPPTVRLLVNNPAASQHGAIVDIPGRLSDVLADPVRNLIYVLRQDKNQLLVYNAANSALAATLPTGSTPAGMNFAADGQHLLVAHDNSQNISVFDMNALQPSATIALPFGFYARSVAASNAQTIAVARNGSAASASGGSSAWIGAEGGPSQVAVLDLAQNTASVPLALGVWTNSVTEHAALAAAPNGASVVLADANGTVMVYSAQANTWVAARHDFTALSGAIAASSYGSYIAGNNVLDGSAVPVGTLDASVGAAAGFAFLNQGGLLIAGSSASGAGAMENLPSVPSAAVKPTQLVEAPVQPGASSAFTRAVSPLSSGTSIVAHTISGITVIAWNYDAPVTPPSISSVVSVADGSQNLAAGGIVNIYGSQLSPSSVSAGWAPLPTTLAQSCVVVNGAPIPLFYVSGPEIAAQLPNNVSGNVSMSVLTPGGQSATYYLNVLGTAPSIFMTGTAGPLTGLAAVVRWNNGQLVTPTNPIHPTDYLEIYLAGMGATTPAVAAGMPGPSNPLAMVQTAPLVTLGGASLPVLYAGMAPGEVGVYQVDVYVPGGMPQGLQIPLQISQGGSTTTVNERVVN